MSWGWGEGGTSRAWLRLIPPVSLPSELGMVAQCGLQCLGVEVAFATLRNSGASWSTVCRETGLSKGTAQRALHSLPKNALRYVSATAAD